VVCTIFLPTTVVRKMPLADKMVRQWAGIERAMKFANNDPSFRPAVESLVDNYFAAIDAIAAELERRRVTER
jgi:hypothetical protein